MNAIPTHLFRYLKGRLLLTRVRVPWSRTHAQTSTHDGLRLQEEELWESCHRGLSESGDNIDQAEHVPCLERSGPLAGCEYQYAAREVILRIDRIAASLSSRRLDLVGADAAEVMGMDEWMHVCVEDE